MLLKGVEIVWVIAARGGAASGKEWEPFARKRAVETVAMIFVGGFTEEEAGAVVVVSSVHAVVEAGGAGRGDAGEEIPFGIGSEGMLVVVWDSNGQYELTDVS